MTSPTMELIHQHAEAHGADMQNVPLTQGVTAALEQRIKELEADAARWKMLERLSKVITPGALFNYVTDPYRLDCSVELQANIDRAMSEAALQKAVDISLELGLP